MARMGVLEVLQWVTKRNIRCHHFPTCLLSQSSDHDALATGGSSLFQVERDHLLPCVGSLVSAWAGGGEGGDEGDDEGNHLWDR